MADILDMVTKLIALASNNPNEQEASRAALKVVYLIRKHNIPLGQVGRTLKVPKKPEADPDFMNTVDEILKGMRDNPNPDDWVPPILYTDTDVDDDFMQKRIKIAWRAIREERKKLEKAWADYYDQTRKKWQPVDWGSYK